MERSKVPAKGQKVLHLLIVGWPLSAEPNGGPGVLHAAAGPAVPAPSFTTWIDANMKSKPASLTETCLAFVLAGGRGSRLHELTDRDCKPAIPFAGSSRIVDFVMANVLNSGIRQAFVATQYQPDRLVSHLRNRWEPRFAAVDGMAACLGSGTEIESEGYRGTADAIYRNIARIDRLKPRHVLVLAADHVYQMDYRPMLERHVATGADITIAADVVPRATARSFGVIAAHRAGRVTGFQEKPAEPAGLPDDPDHALASMGIYVFDWARLRRILIQDAASEQSSHDFGKDIVPAMAARGHAFVHRLEAPLAGGRPYWRDVGTIDALHAAHMDLAEGETALDLEGWPLHSGWLGSRSEVAGNGRPCLIYPGSEAVGAHLDASSIAPLVNIATGALLQKCVVMQGASVAGQSRLRNAIIAPGTRIEQPLVAGFDPEEDDARFRRSAGGILLIDQPMVDRWMRERRVLHPGWKPARAFKAGVPDMPPRRTDLPNLLKTQ